ncbi:MAG: succinate dehydrogenase, cytochrome b556 subunit [Burkholderiales bacterium]|nr:succinate dehydrogenase, cytochrome b556 subunit [Burkholderiales bacterium]
MPRARRPVFLNLARIRYPVGAVASIGHRISGVLLVLALPFAVLALERSLSGEAAISSLLEAVRSPAGRAAMVLVAWACAHHLFAGIRHLVSDAGIGASLAASRRSAHAVLITGALVAAAAALLP